MCGRPPPARCPPDAWSSRVPWVSALLAPHCLIPQFLHEAARPGSFEAWLSAPRCGRSLLFPPALASPSAPAGHGPQHNSMGKGLHPVHGCDSRGQQQEPSGVPEDQGWRAFPQQGPKGLDSEASEALRCWQGSPAPHRSAGPCSGPSLLL